MEPTAPQTTTERADDQAAQAVAADVLVPKVGVWSTEEHERYLQAKFANPKASWKEIARLVGTRSARQVILHDQKFRAKMDRRRSKFERAMTPRHGATAAPVASAAPAGESGPAQAQDELRYFDSMGVLLLASVASSRIPKVPDDAEAGPAEIQEDA